MVDADQLRIIFRINDISFVMPVADLLAIRGSDEDDLSPAPEGSSALLLGSFTYRDAEVKLYDFAALFELNGFAGEHEHKRLVFAGDDGAWAVPVDDVTGVVGVNDFRFQDLPGYLFKKDDSPYQQVALYQDQLLISTDADRVGTAWQRNN